MIETVLSWLDLSGRSANHVFGILGLTLLFIWLLWWGLRRFRKIYRWYLTRGDDEERMEDEWAMRESIIENYLHDDRSDENPSQSGQKHSAPGN